MPTFLTNPKMSPALAARVVASVGGRARTRAGKVFRTAPRVSFPVVGLFVALATVGVFSQLFRWQDEEDIGKTRVALMQTIANERAALGDEGERFLPKTEAWIARLAGTFEGDLITPELRPQGEIETLLTRPAIYVNGPIADLATAARIPEAAAASIKDAFLLCLVEPPPSRAPKALLEAVRGVNFGGAVVDRRTANVHRLHDAEAGLRVLLPAWAERARAAEKSAEFTKLRGELAQAPTREGLLASLSALLLVVVEEQGAIAPPGVAVDGPRTFRVGLVDLTAERVLLRLRRRVDPVSLPAVTRSSYARSVDACALALDVRDALKD